MIEVVVLPLDAKRFRVIALPVSDDSTHALARIERKECVQMIGH